MLRPVISIRNYWWYCYMLLELCDVHQDTRHILIPLEIVINIMLCNGPFLVVLLRLLYLAWEVAYDEAVLTGAIFKDDSTPEPMEGTFSGGTSRRGGSSSRPDAGGYVGLAMVDMDEAERGHGRGSPKDDEAGSRAKSGGVTGDVHAQGQQDRGQQQQQQQHQDDDEDVYMLEDDDEDDEQQCAFSASTPSSPVRHSPVQNSVKGTKSPLKKNVMFDLDYSTEDDGHSSGQQHGSFV